MRYVGCILGTTIAIVAVLLGSAGPAWAQARYDGEEPLERFSIRLGGFRQQDTNSTIRVNSNVLGLGTIIEVEDTLNVEDNVTVARLDGFFRFNPRHRLDWSHYSTKREGNVRVTDADGIQIGDEIFEFGDGISTELKTTLIKIGYSWSFINVAKYEFFVGAGLNFRDLSYTCVNDLGVSTESDSEDAAIPLPVFTFGGRFNFSKKTMVHLKYEAFALKVGDYEGRFQDTTFLFDYNTFKHVGFGGGLNSFQFDLTLEDDEFTGEVETSYLAFLLYLKAYF